MRKIRVVVLDDSLFMREAIRQELEKDCNISVVGKAATVYDARDQIAELEPDVLISDVNLGEISGVEFVRKLLPQYYIPVIMISSDSSNRAAAAGLRVKDFILKPSTGSRQDIDAFYRRLLTSVKTIVTQDILHFSTDHLHRLIIAMGASTGGADVLETILKGMPAVMPPIVITQHMPPQFTRSFAERVNLVSKLSVKEAEEGDMLIPGQVYVAPGGSNMRVRKSSDRYFLTLDDQLNPKKACPNIDTMMYSVAKTHEEKALGIILTGMGRDGALSLKAMHDAGAYTIGQDEKSSVIYGMPQAAYQLGAVDVQLKPGAIAQKCMEWVNKFN